MMSTFRDTCALDSECSGLECVVETEQGIVLIARFDSCMLATQGGQKWDSCVFAALNLLQHARSPSLVCQTTASL